MNTNTYFSLDIKFITMHSQKTCIYVVLFKYLPRTKIKARVAMADYYFLEILWFAFGEEEEVEIACIRGEGNCVEWHSWGVITICTFLPTGLRRHVGQELGRRHGTLGSQQGKRQGYKLRASLVNKPYIHACICVCIHIPKHICIRISANKTMDGYAPLLSCFQN